MPDPADRWMEKARAVWYALDQNVRTGGTSGSVIGTLALALEEVATTERQAGRNEGLEEGERAVHRIMVQRSGGPAEMSLAFACDAIRSLKTPQAAGEEKPSE